MKPALTSLVGLLLVGVVLPASAQEILVDFRRDKVEQGEFNWDGAKAEEFIKPEAEGLRWRFTVGRAPKKAVGVSWKTRLDGDFTVTAQYEILRADKPAQGIGVGAEMYLTLDTPEPRDALVFTRVVQVDGEAIFNLTQMINDEKKNRVGKVIARQIAGPRSARGRLRLLRDGKTFIALAAEADDDEFKEIGRRDIGAMRVLKARFAGLEGGTTRPELDMRLLEFHLTEKKLLAPAPALKNADAPAPKPKDVGPAPAAETKRTNLWIVIALVAVVLLVLLAAIALVVVSRRKAKTPEHRVQKKKKLEKGET